MNIRRTLSLLAVAAALCAHPGTSCAQTIFVTDIINGTIGEYDAVTGVTINSTLVSGLDMPAGLALAGNRLFVANEGGTVGEYTTSGATVNASLISIGIPVGIAVSGNKLFVVDRANGTIGEYTTSGAVVNASLVSGLDSPFGLALSDGKLFVVNNVSGTIGVYDAATGATISSALVSGLTDPRFVALHEGSLFVSEDSTLQHLGSISEYDALTGAPIDIDIGLFQFALPRGIAFFRENLLLANGNFIEEITPSGQLIPGGFVEGLPLGILEQVVVGGVPDTGPGVLLFGVVLLSLHFFRRRILA